MVTYTYSVNAEGPVSSIQAVIDLIALELATNPTIESDIQILVGKGSYAGFTIPDGMLFPLFNTAYRLVVKPQGDYFPIIDFNYSPDTQYIGIDVGSGNPNVTIQGLRVQYFAVGIRVGLNSHYPIVFDNIVNNNRNVGIFFEQAAQSQAIQNVVINGDYGIVVRLCKSAALVHNTIFMNGAIASTVGKSLSCVWAELANDYGNGLADTGKLHLIGNVGWNTSGRCLTLFTQDVERAGCIFSNFNDWVIGDPNEFIVLEDNAFYLGSQSSPRRVLTNLSQWKDLGKDQNSKSEDPRFIAPVKIRAGRNAYALDLNILPISPVLGIVPSFPYDSTAASQWLPTYLDTSYLTKDIIGNPRAQAGTAAGCNEKASTAGFYGQDVFSNPLDLDLQKNCEIDPFSNVLFKSIDLWMPKIKRGYFYSHEREYYLYSKKGAATLGQLAVTKFVLPAALSYSKAITVTVAGDVVDSSYIDLCGNKLLLFHKDLPIVDGNEEVQVEGSISSWNGTSFNYNEVLYRFKINQGQTRYYLPEDYVNVGPVVITDDMCFPTDSDYTANREFAVTYDPQMNRSEIVFSNNTNQVTNGQFDYTVSGAPTFWQSNLATVIPATPELYNVAGQNLLSVENGGFIRTMLDVNDQEPSSLSFHTKSMGSGALYWDIEYYDSNYDLLGYVVTGSVDLKSEWSRYSLTFTTGNPDYDSVVPQVPYPCIPLNTYVPPTRSAHMSVRLSHVYSPAYTGAMYLDAIQYEKTNAPTLYHRKPFFPELTVEYETSTDDHFIDTHLSISPATNLISDGFIYIPEIPSVCYGGPDTPAITTLHEWKWPSGRLFVMPWARTKGKDKLRKRPYRRFNLIPDPKPELVSPVNFSAVVRDINIFPSIPTTFLGDTNGVGFTIKVTDSDGNPHAQNTITATLTDYNAKYPGLLSRRKYGLKEQLGVSVGGMTDSSGGINLVWVPPDENAASYRGSIPDPTMVSSSSDRITVIKTDYPVNLDSYGNVIIFDYLGVPIDTKASAPVREIHTPVYNGGNSSAVLKYPVAAGDISVVVDGVQYQQNQINLLDSNQFFVDYENSTVTVKGRVTNIDVQYRPSYVYVSQVDPYKIMLYYDKIFGSYSNSIVLGYDFSVRLTVTVADPANQSTFSRDFELIAQSALSNKVRYFNTLALEF